MVHLIYFILSLCSACTISALTINSWSDWWIAPVSFVGTELAFALLFAITMWFFSRFVSKNKQYNKYNKFYHYFLGYCMDYLLGIFNYSTKLIGKEKLPKNKKFLLVCNHISGFDPIITYQKLRKYPLSFISKPSIFKIPMVGNLMKRNGFIPINRENDREALTAILRGIKQLKDDEYCVGVYPEGTRNTTEETLLPFKSGCFKMATKADCPVVVMSIKGSDKITKRYPWKHTKVTLEVIDVLNPQDFENTVDLSDKAKELIENNLKENKKA